MNIVVIGRQYTTVPVARRGSAPVRDGGAVQVALALVLRGSKVLIARRPKSAHLGGLWEFPGGKIEAGESSATAALRELLEELNVHAQVMTVWQPIHHRYGEQQVVLHPVICRYRSGLVVPVGCISPRWIPRKALLRYRFPAANQRLIQGLTEGRAVV